MYFGGMLIGTVFLGERIRGTLKLMLVRKEQERGLLRRRFQ